MIESHRFVIDPDGRIRELTTPTGGMVTVTATTPTGHRWLSPACYHLDHHACAVVCAHCGGPCMCSCHRATSAEGPTRDSHPPVGVPTPAGSPR